MNDNSPTKLFASLFVICQISCATAQPLLNPPSNREIDRTTEEELNQLIRNIERNSVNQNTSKMERPTQFSVLETQSDSIPENKTEDQVNSNQLNELNRLLTAIVLNNLPHEYSQDKKWGKQSKRWSGIKFRRDEEGGKIETKRRYKMVNHGTWQKYHARLKDPKKQFNIQLNQVDRASNGNTLFDITFDSDIQIEARQAKWVKGIQLYSVSVEGNASINLNVICEIGIDLDLSQMPPEVVFAPEIKAATIELDDFKLDRISKVCGEIAQQATKFVRKELEDSIDEKERKLVKRLNDQISKKQSSLRLGIGETFNLPWFEQAKPFLPVKIQETSSK